MVKLEDIHAGIELTGVTGNVPVRVVAVDWHGNAALTLHYQTSQGASDSTLLFRDDESRLATVGNSSWSFEGDADELKLVSEAYRINLAHLFDPYLAVRTSAIDPLPHQISAVYETMLQKMPLRFVLADDPGAGKTIMAGLLIKEMLARGDLRRCLIVSPGNLVEQWQDELYRKFGLVFTIMTNDLFEAAATRNAFKEHELCIARLDKLSRDDQVRELLSDTNWDLIVVDEAHKMSASLTGNEIKYTKRYRLGRLLGDITENLLLMTATPHNGKPEDFQLFMALVDRDRFEGAAHMPKSKGGNLVPRFGEIYQGVPDDFRRPAIDVDDLMRRLVKEELLRFDGRPLFPERIAQTVTYTLSPAEADLYAAVTDYVTNQFNLADRLDGKRRNSVGFALTILQRRLASSPEAIYQSLRRRRDRLEARLNELNATGRIADTYRGDFFGFNEDFDEDDLPSEEYERMEDEVIDSASASASADELRKEISVLNDLVSQAKQLRMSGEDRKWDELSHLLQDNGEMFDANGRREKLIVFTEHKDTLEYLADKIRRLLGNHDAVLTIKGGMPRDERHRAEEQFKQDKDVRVLVATDAAGEGINLQRAHLMVNYDLPWNPNRIEQRFGRIHRIGQTEVCYLWNLVAKETREGQVFDRLFQKLDEERVALGGRVFDILGSVTFDDKPLRELLVEAIRYGDLPEVRERLNRVVDGALDTSSLKELLDKYALTTDVMDVDQVMRIREDMERMEARKLEPHFIEAFFLEAMKALGGRVVQREEGRYEVLEVPFAVRSRDMHIGAADPVLKSYERICFEKELCDGAIVADLVCPGHPLLDATVQVMLEQHLSALKRGTILVDDDETATVPRLLTYIESAIQDETLTDEGKRRTVHKAVHFVELDYDGNATDAGYAPYLDYRAPTEAELAAAKHSFAEEIGWLSDDPETLATDYAITQLIPKQLKEVQRRTSTQVAKVRRAVETRLTAEIQWWDGHAWELKEREDAGKPNNKQNSAYAGRRANELEERLHRRVAQLELQEKLHAIPPRIIGGALVVPASMLRADVATDANGQSTDAAAKQRTERRAMEAVKAIERELGYDPHDVSMHRKIGYDIESVVPKGMRQGNDPVLRMIEVKGRLAGADTVTLTKSEIYCRLNSPENWILALVEVDGSTTHTRYLRKPLMRAPVFTENNTTYDLGRLVESAEVILERTDTWQ
ncbi:MAG: DUF3883 domain-containing protein [Atopobiaceae bacterium]|nr:DUF3883 domain-containing protein [Atopobiaceae bacterium]